MAGSTQSAVIRQPTHASAKHHRQDMVGLPWGALPMPIPLHALPELPVEDHLTACVALDSPKPPPMMFGVAHYPPQLSRVDPAHGADSPVAQVDLSPDLLATHPDPVGVDAVL